MTAALKTIELIINHKQAVNVGHNELKLENYLKQKKSRGFNNKYSKGKSKTIIKTKKGEK